MLTVTSPVALSVSEVEHVLWLAGLQHINHRFSPGFQSALQNCLSVREPALLINRSVTHKCAPFLWEALRSSSLANNDFAPLGPMVQVYRIVNEVIYKGVEPILQTCRRQNIPAMLIKGSGLYDDGSDALPRVMYDVDILVRPPDVETVRRIFLDNGYVHGRLDTSALTIRPLALAERESIESAHYELAPFLKILRLPELDPYSQVISQCLSNHPVTAFGIVGDEVYFFLSYDVHHNLSIDFDVRDIWYKPRTIKLPGGEVADAQNASDLVWFLAARLYHETMLFNDGCLRVFFDLLKVMSEFGPGIDWERIQSVVEKYDLQPSLYYSLRHIREILGPVVPEEIVERFSPCGPQVKRFHDWGDFLPKLLNGCAVYPAVFDVESSIAAKGG